MCKLLASQQVSKTKHPSVSHRFRTQSVRGIHVQLKSLILFLYFVNVFQMVSSLAMIDPPISLDNHPGGNIHFDIEAEALDLVVDHTGLVLYTSVVEHARQIKAVSKVFDFASLGLANANAKQSLIFLENRNQLNTLENFVLLGIYEYHISPETMSYEECPIYCASKMSRVVNTATDFFVLLKHFHFNRVWVHTKTSTQKVDGQLVYNIHLGSNMVYPRNTLSARDKVKIYTFHNNKKQLIPSIHELYSYYDSQSKSYWTEHPSQLHVAISTHLSVSVYIAENPLHLLTGDYKEQCPCMRLPSRSDTVFRDLITEYHHLSIQMDTIGLGLEEERVDKDNPKVGTLPALVYPFLAPERRKKPPNFRFHQQGDLNALIPTNTSADLLASSMIYYGATKIGPPIVLAMLKPTLTDLAKNLGAKLYDKLSPSEKIHEFVKISGLNLEYTNYSLVLEYDNLPAFSRNISLDMVLTHSLLKNLTLTNQIFANFLANEVEQILLGMASNQLTDKIDTTVPILGKVSKRKSFVLIDFYFSVYVDTKSITNYTAVSLPLTSSDDKLWGLKVPASFSTQPAQPGFLFPDDITDHRLADGCISAFLSNGPDLKSMCGTADFSDQRLIQLLTLSHQRIMLARGIGSILKISCSNERLLVHTLVQDILIFIVPHTCDLHMATEAGNIVKPAAATLTPASLFLRPKLLFSYDLYYILDTNSLQNVFIYVLLGFLILFVLLTAFLIVYACKRKVSVSVESENVSLSTLSQTTIRRASLPDHREQAL